MSCGLYSELRLTFYAPVLVPDSIRHGKTRCRSGPVMWEFERVESWTEVNHLPWWRVEVGAEEDTIKGVLRFSFHFHRVSISYERCVHSYKKSWIIFSTIQKNHSEHHIEVSHPSSTIPTFPTRNYYTHWITHDALFCWVDPYCRAEARLDNHWRWRLAITSQIFR